MSETENIKNFLENVAKRRKGRHYKWCMVPTCRNSSFRTPNKLFISVPRNPARRILWLKAIKLGRSLPHTSSIYCCVDHFQLEEDMENFVRFKLTGGQVQVRMKESVVPHIFDCQEETGAVNTGPVLRSKTLKARSEARPKARTKRKSRKAVVSVATEGEMDCDDWTTEEKTFFDIGDCLKMETNEDEDEAQRNAQLGSYRNSCDDPFVEVKRENSPVVDWMPPYVAESARLPHRLKVEKEGITNEGGSQSVGEEQPVLGGEKLPPTTLKVKGFAREMGGEGDPSVYGTSSKQSGSDGQPLLEIKTERPDFSFVDVDGGSFAYVTNRSGFSVEREKQSEEASFVYEAENSGFIVMGVEHQSSEEESFVYETENSGFSVTGANQSEEASFVHETENLGFNDTGMLHQSSEEESFVHETEISACIVTRDERLQGATFVYDSENSSCYIVTADGRSETASFVFETENSGYFVTADGRSEVASFVLETESVARTEQSESNASETENSDFIFATGEERSGNAPITRETENLDDTGFSVGGEQESEGASFENFCPEGDSQESDSAHLEGERCGAYPVSLWKSALANGKPEAISRNDTERDCEVISSEGGGARVASSVDDTRSRERQSRKQKFSPRSEYYNPESQVRNCLVRDGSFYRQVYTDSEEESGEEEGEEGESKPQPSARYKRRKGRVGYQQNARQQTDSEESGSESGSDTSWFDQWENRREGREDRETRMRRREAKSPSPVSEEGANGLLVKASPQQIQKVEESRPIGEAREKKRACIDSPLVELAWANEPIRASGPCNRCGTRPRRKQCLHVV